MSEGEFDKFVDRIHAGKEKGYLIYKEKLRGSNAFWNTIELENTEFLEELENGNIEPYKAEKVFHQEKAKSLKELILEYRGDKKLSEDEKTKKIKDALEQVIKKTLEDIWAYGVYDVAILGVSVNWGVKYSENNIDAKMFDFWEITDSKEEAIQELGKLINKNSFEKGWEIMDESYASSIISLAGKNIAEWFLGRVKEEFTLENLEKYWGIKTTLLYDPKNKKDDLSFVLEAYDNKKQGKPYNPALASFVERIEVYIKENLSREELEKISQDSDTLTSVSALALLQKQYGHVFSMRDDNYPPNASGEDIFKKLNEQHIPDSRVVHLLAEIRFALENNRALATEKNLKSVISALEKIESSVTLFTISLFISKNKGLLETALDSIPELNDPMLKANIFYDSLNAYMPDKMNLSPGAEKFIKLYIYWKFSEYPGATDPYSLLQEVSRDIIPMLQISDDLYKDIPSISCTIKNKLGTDNMKNLELVRKPFNIFMNLNINNHAELKNSSNIAMIGGEIPLSVEQRELDIPMIQGNYLVTFLNILMYMKLGFIDGAPSYSTAINSDLGYDDFFIHYSSMFSDKLLIMTLKNSLSTFKQIQDKVIFYDRNFSWLDSPDIELTDSTGKEISKEGLMIKIFKMDLEIKSILFSCAANNPDIYKKAKDSIKEMLQSFKDAKGDSILTEEDIAIYTARHEDFSIKTHNKPDFKTRFERLKVIDQKITNHISNNTDDFDRFFEAFVKAASLLKEEYYERYPFLKVFERFSYRSLDNASIFHDIMLDFSDTDKLINMLFEDHPKETYLQVLSILEVTGDNKSYQAIKAFSNYVNDPALKEKCRKILDKGPQKSIVLANDTPQDKESGSSIGGKMVVVTAAALGTLGTLQANDIPHDISQIKGPKPITQYVDTDSLPKAIDLLNKYDNKTPDSIIKDFLGKFNSHTLISEDISDIIAILKTEGTDPKACAMAIWYLELAFDSAPELITRETASSLMDILKTEKLDMPDQKNACDLLIKVLSNKIDLITAETVPFFEWLFENKAEVLLGLRKDKKPSESEINAALAQYWAKLDKTLEKYPPNGSECRINIQTLKDFGYNSQEIQTLNSQLENLINELDLQKLTSLPEIERIHAFVDLIKIRLNLLGGNSFFDLPDIFAKGDGCCLLAAQLGYVLGEAIGLPMKIISVKRDDHAANAVELEDGAIVFIDLSADTHKTKISKSFKIEDKYYKDGEYWKLRDNKALFRLSDGPDIFAKFEDIRFCKPIDISASRIDSKEELYGKFAVIISKIEFLIDFTALGINEKGYSKEELHRIAEIEKGIGIDPKNLNLYNGLIGLYLNQSAILKHRLENYDKYKSLPPKEQVEEWVSYNPERSARAIELYEKILELKPDYIDAYFSFVELLRSEIDNINTLLKDRTLPEESKDSLNDNKSNMQKRIEDLKKKIKEIQEQMLDSLDGDGSKKGSFAPLFPIGFFRSANKTSYKLDGQPAGPSIMDALNILVWIKEVDESSGTDFELNKDSINIVGINGDAKSCTDKYILKRLESLKPDQIISVIITDKNKKQALEEKLKGIAPKDKLFFTEIGPYSLVHKQWSGLIGNRLSCDFKHEIKQVSDILDKKELYEALAQAK